MKIPKSKQLKSAEKKQRNGLRSYLEHLQLNNVKKVDEYILGATSGLPVGVVYKVLNVVPHFRYDY